MKENAPLYVDGEDMKNHQQNKKEDTSINYFSQTDYWGPLVPNDESVDKINNTYFNNNRASSIVVNEAEFVLVFKTNMIQYPYVQSNFKI